jgi:hypothetical protein
MAAQMHREQQEEEYAQQYEGQEEMVGPYTSIQALQVRDGDFRRCEGHFVPDPAPIGRLCTLNV